MTTISALADHLTSLVEDDAILLDYLNDNWLYLGVAETYPSITMEGIRAVDDKLDTYAMDLNLWAKQSEATSALDLEFYEMAQRLKDLLSQSCAILGGAFVSRNEPQNAILRVQFPCTVYLRNLS